VVEIVPGTVPRKPGRDRHAARGATGGASTNTLVVPEALLEQSRRTQRLSNIVMGCIAGISLLVGGIGNMNTCWPPSRAHRGDRGASRGGRHPPRIRKPVRGGGVHHQRHRSLLGIGMGIASRRACLLRELDTIVTATSIVLATAVARSGGPLVRPLSRAARGPPRSIDALR